MDAKIKGIILVLLLLLINISIISNVGAHVCSDVLPGGSQYKEGCEPIVITVPSASQDGNIISLTINVENRQTPYAPATSCGNPWSGTITNVRIASVSPTTSCSGCFTMNNPGTYNIPINTNRNYNAVVTISSSATPGTYTLRFIVSFSEGVNRYIDVEGIVVEESSCTPNCAGKNCGDDGCGGSCGSCDDSNSCTTDSCSGGTCTHTNVANGATCGSGHCCSGVCDTTTGNTGYVSGCRSGPSCVGTSWEYSIANNGNLCGGYTCMECNNGYCNSQDPTRCSAVQTCTSGNCVSSCTSVCTNGAKQCNTSTSYQTCSDTNSDGCYEWGVVVACSSPNPYCSSGNCVQCTSASQCSDNVCKTPTCSGNVCGETNVASGLTDTGCSGSTGCSGGSCKCDGAGSCTSQPSCSSVCSPAGSRQCSGTSNQTCYDTNSDGCLEWGSLVACPDTICSEPTCSSGNCGSTYVSSGSIDEACYSNNGCSGGSCKCNGAGSCTSQPGCTSECTSGEKECSGNSYRVCSDLNSDGCYEWSSWNSCSGSTPYCSLGSCVQCTSASQCDDSNNCTTDTCSGGTCSHSNLADGSVCGTGRCCSGTCDITLGNPSFHEDCRSGPSCVGTSWQYSYTNNGNLCGGYDCRECSNGMCVSDDNTRCGSEEICSSGTCSTTGCTSNSNCFSPTPFCNTTSHQCVQCFQASDCNDNNSCTTDTCSSNICTHTSGVNGQTCTGCSSTLENACQCSSGVCACVPSCTGKLCGSNGCGGTCGTCNSYINGSRCYDSSVCSSGVCGFTTNTLTTSSNCCDHRFALSNSNCIEENVPNSSKCTGDTYCSSLCSCIPNPCGEYDSASECNSQSSCEWCTLSSECMSEDEIECASGSQCYANGQYCDSCKLRSCLGTLSSCGCNAGSCTICTQGQACTNNLCIQSTASCTPSWTCSEWSECSSQGTRTRICTDGNRCNNLTGRPAITEACVYNSLGGSGADTSALGGDSTEDQKNLSGSVDKNNVTTDRASAKGLGSVVWIIIGVVLLAVLVGVYFFFKGSQGGKQKKQAAKGYFSSLRGSVSKQESSSVNEMSAQNSAGVKSSYGSYQSPSLTAEQEAKLDKYVKYYLDKNIASEYIVQYLVGKGWTADVVNNSLRKFPSSSSSRVSVTQTQLSREEKLDKYVKYYLDKNIASEYIVQYLVGKGWTEDEVKSSLKKFGK